MNPMAAALTDPSEIADRPSAREQEVLSVVLDLMVEEGDGFSMAAVARRASCSKETLYRWFGDRDGLLTATVKWQAAKVIMPELRDGEFSHASFVATLESFAQSWLEVLTGEVSIALNRLAVSHAGNGNSNLGRIVLENGPLAMQARLAPIFDLGFRQGFIRANDETVFRLFFGLVVGDVQIRALLGDQNLPDGSRITNSAKQAVDSFLGLVGTETTKSNKHS